MATAQVQVPHNPQAIQKADSQQTNDTIVIHAADLTIFKGDDPNHWQWIYEPDTNGVEVEVAELLRINKLDVSAKIPADNLDSRKHYQVDFVLKMTDDEVGFKDHPVKFELAIPGKPAVKHEKDLSELGKNKWAVISVGGFYREPNMIGDLKISMFEGGSQEKGGMIVNKIVIHPR